MLHYDDGDLVNIGWGEEDQTIKELAETICEVVGYHGKLRFDPTRPDGTPRKVLDVSRLKALRWQPKITLRKVYSRFIPFVLRNMQLPDEYWMQQAIQLEGNSSRQDRR